MGISNNSGGMTLTVVNGVGDIDEFTLWDGSGDSVGILGAPLILETTAAIYINIGPDALDYLIEVIEENYEAV